MISEPAPSVREACLFLAAYGARLLGCGATCIRIDKNVERMAQAWQMTVDLTIMPRHIHLTVRSQATAEVFTSTATIPPSAVSYDMNTRLSELSWEVADGKCGFEACREAFGRIAPGEVSTGPVPTLLLVAAANAAFCRLFGGDAVAMLVVAVATLAGYKLKTLLLERGCDLRAVVLVCAFVSTVLGATDSLFSLGTTPELAVGTSVLYLVPGIPLLNSFSDFLYRRYICAMSRFCDAMVLTGCLSLGLLAGLAMMGTGMF